MGKVIFRKIAGRLVPIRVAAGFTPDATVLQSSAKLRAAIKATAAARTSLQEKRIQAVASVRRMVSDCWSIFDGPSKSVFDTSLGPKIPGKNWTRVGRGSSVIAVADPLRPGWLVKKGNSPELHRRGINKAILSKHGLAPETFHVQTKNKDYLVQKIVKPQKSPDTTPQALAAAKQVDALAAKVRRVGITPQDIGLGVNVGHQRGKLKVLDSGAMKLQRWLPPTDRARVQKFQISGRDYLAPLDQEKYFKRKK